MSNEERKTLAGRIRMQRKDQFGTKSAAYQAANVNAATWDRAEDGAVVREDRLIQVLKTLWPESGGDWTAVLYPPAPKQAGWHPWLADDESAPDASLTEFLEEMDGRVGAVENRLANVERFLRTVLDKQDLEKLRPDESLDTGDSSGTDAEVIEAFPPGPVPDWARDEAAYTSKRPKGEAFGNQDRGNGEE